MMTINQNVFLLYEKMPRFKWHLIHVDYDVS